jgi:hypothetical protein
VVNLGTAGGSGYEFLSADASGSALTLGTHVTINANGTGGNFAGLAGNTVVNAALINIGGTGFDINANTATNTGEIIASSGARLQLDGQNFVNSGTLDALAGSNIYVATALTNTGAIEIGQNGYLDLATNNFGNLGSVAVRGGDIYLAGRAALNQFSGVTFSDSGGYTTDFDVANSGSLELNGAVFTIAGADVLEVDGGGVLSDGTVDTALAPVLLTSGASLHDMTFVGALNGPANGGIYVSGGLDVENPSGGQPGTINLVNFGNVIRFEDSETLDHVVVNLGTAGGSGYEYLSADASGSALTLGTHVTINANGTGGNFAGLTGNTVENDGLISIGGSGFDINANTASNTGQIIASSGARLQLDGQNFVNTGTLDALAGSNIYVATAFTNTGAIEIGQNGYLDLATNNFGNLGSVAVRGGDIYLAGRAALNQFSGVTMSDSGGYTTDFDVANSGSLELNGAVFTIAGADVLEVDGGGVLSDGTVDTALATVLLTSGASLHDMTYIGALNGPASGVAYISGGLTVENAAGGAPGTINLVNFANVLRFEDSETLDDVVVNLGTAGGSGYEFLSADAGGSKLILGTHVTINANGLGGNFAGLAGNTVENDGLINIGGSGFDFNANTASNTGLITASFGSQLQFTGQSFVNTGTLDALAGANIYVTGAFTNAGAIEIGAGGYLDLATSNFGNLGSVAVSGGRVYLAGQAALGQFSGVTFSDGGGTTLFDIANSGSLELNGAVFTIAGADMLEVDGGGVLSDGTVDTALATVLLTSGASLHDMTFVGALNGPASGGIYVSGGLDVENAAGGAPGTINLVNFGNVLRFEDSETLDHVVVNLGTAGGSGYEFVSADASGSALTLGTHVTINANGTGGNFSGLAGNTVANAGLIDIGGSGFDVSANDFTNAGLMKAEANAELVFNGTSFENDGTIIGFSGAHVLVQDGVTGTGKFIIDPSLLTLDGSVSSGQVISFSGTGGELELGNAAQFNGTITGAANGDTILLDNFVVNTDSFATGTGLVLNNGAATLDIAGPFSTSNFTISVNGGNSEIFVICYLRGTRIATPGGEVAIEDLRIGDAVMTKFGGVQKIRWIGRQSFDRRFLAQNRELFPVRIEAGALGENIPARDLYVSGGHSMLVDGVLVLAKHLVNGVTITQHYAPEVVEYYQLEFYRHDCVLAEGAWSESYADCAGMRAQFHNAAEYAGLYPPRRVPARPMLCAPRPECGPALAAAILPALLRAEAFSAPGRLLGCIDRISPAGLVEGWAWDAENPELPVRLECLVDGMVVGTALAFEYRADLAHAGMGQGRCGFTLMAPGRVRLRRAADGAVLGLKTESRLNVA